MMNATNTVNTINTVNTAGSAPHIPAIPSVETTVKIYRHPDGQCQRVQLVRLPGWDPLNFISPVPAPGTEALNCFSHIYEKFLVPAFPWIFSNMVLFQLPENASLSLSLSTDAYGRVADPLTAAAAILQEGVRIRHGKPVFRSAMAKDLWDHLASHDCLRLVRGKLPATRIIPVGRNTGYLSQTAPGSSLRVNSSFFIMDPFDCATIYDHVGTPFGLCIKDGTITSPPLFEREALLVRRDGTVSVHIPRLRDLEVQIGDTSFRHGKNAEIFTRPQMRRTPPRRGIKLVIIGCRVVAVSSRLQVPVPASGFVLCPGESFPVSPGDPVSYRGMEDFIFGIQVGNSILRDGQLTDTFLSPFYNIRRLEPVPFPPSLYPLNFRTDRAARIVLGSDRAGHPMILWAEGAAKFGYQAGTDSTGASLSELGSICRDMGMINAINLDGGGSAQILLNENRRLKISDRSESDGTETERPIPLGLMM